jgi:hypothetical protein
MELKREAWQIGRHETGRCGRGVKSLYYFLKNATILGIFKTSESIGICFVVCLIKHLA